LPHSATGDVVDADNILKGHRHIAIKATCPSILGKRDKLGCTVDRKPLSRSQNAPQLRL
jgi:hypothetical protein